MSRTATSAADGVRDDLLRVQVAVVEQVGDVLERLSVLAQDGRDAAADRVRVEPALVLARPVRGLLVAEDPTPWLEYPGLYSARCRSAGGAGWLEVKKATGASDKRPTVIEDVGPDWGYHRYDVNLALGNLVADVAGAGKTWLRTHRTG